MKRKILSFSILLLVLVVFIINTTSAKTDLKIGGETSYGALFYNANTGYITNVDRSQEKTDIIIPKSIKRTSGNIDIVGIADLAFAHYHELKYITIPSTVNSIADDAFIDTEDGLTIKCISGSYAEQYAIEHNMEYEIISEKEYNEKLQEQEENTEDNNSFSDMQKIENIIVDFIKGIKQGSIKENIVQLDLEDTYDFKFYSSDGEELDEDEPIATGMKIVIYDEEGNVLKEHTIVLYGDTDGDGKITKEDAKKIIQNKLKKKQFEEECYEQAGNILSENTPTAIDALAIIKAEQGKYEIKQSNNNI